MTVIQPLIAPVLAGLRVAMTVSPSITVEGKPYLTNQERSDNRWGRSKTVGAIREAAGYKWLAEKHACENSADLACHHFPFDRYVVVAEPRYPNKAHLPDTGSCLPSVKAIIDGARDAGVVTDDKPVNVAAHIELPVVVLALATVTTPHIKVWIVPTEEKS
jgi:hypothetical protein